MPRPDLRMVPFEVPNRADCSAAGGVQTGGQRSSGSDDASLRQFLKFCVGMTEPFAEHAVII